MADNQENIQDQTTEEMFVEETPKVWFEEYELLSSNRKNKFTEYANRLLSSGFIIKTKPELQDAYYFIVKHEFIYEEYFKLINWQLRVDKNLGIITLKNHERRNRVSFKLHESITLLILRLLFDQRSEAVNLSNNVVVKIGEIHEMYSTIGLNDKIMTKAQLRSVLSVLKRYNIIDIDNTTTVELDKEFSILPTVLYAVETDNITDVYNHIRGYSNEEGEADEEA